MSHTFHSMISFNLHTKAFETNDFKSNDITLWLLTFHDFKILPRPIKLVSLVLWLLTLLFHLILELRKFLVDRASIKNVNVVQPESKLEPRLRWLMILTQTRLCMIQVVGNKLMSMLRIFKTKWGGKYIEGSNATRFSKSLDDIDIIQTFTAKKSQKGYLSPSFI